MQTMWRVEKNPKSLWTLYLEAPFSRVGGRLIPLLFAVTVNMVLINMMMAIINMAFEEVKVHKEKFKSRFQLFEYIRRSAKELYGSTYAKPITVKYGKNDGSSSDHEGSLNSITQNSHK